jgi:hypothetical protein
VVAALFAATAAKSTSAKTAKEQDCASMELNVGRARYAKAVRGVLTTNLRRSVANATAACTVITARGGGCAGEFTDIAMKRAHVVTQSLGNAKGRTFVRTTKSSTIAASARRRVTFVNTTATRRGARSARAAACARTTESDHNAKSARVGGFANTTDTEQAAKSVAEAAYVHTAASDASARNAEAAKSAGTAAKGALHIALLD